MRIWISQRSLALNACGHICTEQTWAWSKQLLIFHRILIKVNGNRILLAVHGGFSKESTADSCICWTSPACFWNQVSHSVSAIITISRWAEVANSVMPFCHHKTFWKVLCYLFPSFLSGGGFSHDCRIKKKADINQSPFSKKPPWPSGVLVSDSYDCRTPGSVQHHWVSPALSVPQLLESIYSGPSWQSSPKPCSTNRQILQPLNAQSWSHSQPQLLLFHDWHCLEPALLKGCFRFFFFISKCTLILLQKG